MKLFCLCLMLAALAACGREAATVSERRDMSENRKISPADLDLGRGTEVVSDAQKFIIPVPAFGDGGEPLVYPAGHEQAGKPVLDFEGKPVGERGMVFFNDKDRTVQAVGGDGAGVVIINEVTSEQGARLRQKIEGLNPDPSRLTLPQLKEVLDYARKELKLGDMYNSTRSFVKEKMTPAGGGEASKTEAYGLMKRDDRDICRAVYVPGRFTFEGPAATPQVFEDGGVIVEQGGKFRGVQPDIFARTYRLRDGRPVKSVKDDIQVRDAGAK